jgi:peptide subunit release factor 1 (eRF1)
VDFKHENDEQILDRARRLREQHERESEEELVRRIVEGAEAGGDDAVVGVKKTIEAIQRGAVRSLAILSDAREKGAECLRCDYFEAKSFERCPLCGGEAEATSNILARAQERALLSGAEVDVILGDASRDSLRDRGGIGAILRY